MEFEFAPDEKIEHYQPEVDILLTEMGFDPREVLVTDESELQDFYWDDDEEWEDLKSNMFKRYGLRIECRERIWKVAERMKYGG